MKVAVVGASNKPERYSHMAVLTLKEKGHEVYPVNPALSDVAGLPVYKRFGDIPGGVDTVTVYLGTRNQGALGDDLLDGAPKRVIFNPGTENPDLAQRLHASGIEVVNACTLVMLKTGQF